MKTDTLTMETICNGAVKQRINRALVKIAENILDPNADVCKKRSITIKLTFIPDEDNREDVTVTADVKTTLAPESGTTTRMTIRKDEKAHGILISEHQNGEIKGQISLNDLGITIEDTATPKDTRELFVDELRIA